jgi:hypothetical protein
MLLKKQGGNYLPFGIMLLKKQIVGYKDNVARLWGKSE